MTLHIPWAAAGFDRVRLKMARGAVLLYLPRLPNGKPELRGRSTCTRPMTYVFGDAASRFSALTVSFLLWHGRLARVSCNVARASSP